MRGDQGTRAPVKKEVNRMGSVTAAYSHPVSVVGSNYVSSRLGICKFKEKFGG